MIAMHELVNEVEAYTECKNALLELAQSAHGSPIRVVLMRENGEDIAISIPQEIASEAIYDVQALLKNKMQQHQAVAEGIATGKLREKPLQQNGIQIYTNEDDWNGVK